MYSGDEGKESVMDLVCIQWSVNFELVLFARLPQ